MIDHLRIPSGYFYLASPYSKYYAGLHAAFEDICQIAGKLIALGVPVYSPIAHTHPVAIHSGMNPLDHEIWLPADKPMFEAAHGLIVAQMDGWADSYGVQVEIQWAREAGKPVHYLLPDDLEKFFDARLSHESA